MKTRTILIFSLSLLFGCTTLQRNPAATIMVAQPTNLQINLKECFSPELNIPLKNNLEVNGYDLEETQAKNIQWISHCVRPFLPGTKEQQSDIAAKATWWALREGVLDFTTMQAVRFSSCDAGGSRDRNQSNSPTMGCVRGHAWQVGMAAGQVPNYSKSELTGVMHLLFPGITENEILDWTAQLAGFMPGTPEHNAILKTPADDIKRSWLLRNPVIGAMVVSRSEVQIECLKQNAKWCLARTNVFVKNKKDKSQIARVSTPIRFSNSPADMQKTIADLKHIYLSDLAE